MRTFALASVAAIAFAETCKSGYEYIRVEGAAIHGENEEEIYKVSPEDCQEYCNERDWCKSIDYNRTEFMCKLSKSSLTEPDCFDSNCRNNYDWYGKKLSDEFTYKHVPGAAIHGWNDANFYDVSPENCQGFCNEYDWCKSIDYSRTEGMCKLSRSALTEPDCFDSNCTNNYDWYGKVQGFQCKDVTFKWHEDNCDDRDCDWEDCQEYDHNFSGDPCWKEVCSGCGHETCQLWYEVRNDWVTDDCVYSPSYPKYTLLNVLKETNEAVHEDFDTTIETVQDMFCQGGKCAEALGAQLSEMVKSQIPDEEYKNIAEQGLEEMDNAFMLDNQTDAVVDAMDGKTEAFEPDCEGFLCDVIKSFFDGFSGF